MRKKFLALSLAVIVSAAQVMTVSASKQEKLQQQQAAQAETSAQLDNAKAEIWKLKRIRLPARLMTWTHSLS